MNTAMSMNNDDKRGTLVIPREVLSYCAKKYDTCIRDCTQKNCEDTSDLCFIVFNDCLSNPVRHGYPRPRQLDPCKGFQPPSKWCYLRNALTLLSISYIASLLLAYPIIYGVGLVLNVLAGVTAVNTYAAIGAAAILTIPLFLKLCQSKTLFGPAINPTYIPGRKYQCLYWACVMPHETPCFKRYLEARKTGGLGNGR